MTRGKRTCKILKEIRQQIADNNDIEYVISECHFQGECKGTCPKCEAEVKYLEKELAKRRQLGKVVTIAGISLGVAGSFSACNAPRENDISVLELDTLSIVSNDTIDSDTMPFPPILGKARVDTIIETLEMDGLVLDDYDNSYDEIEIDSLNDDPIFGLVAGETEPHFPGGESELFKFLQKNLVYPLDAKEQKIEGRVIVSFIIDTNGSLTNIEIARGKHPSLDAEAIRVVKLMPKWKPGELNWKKVEVKYNLPIQFTLGKNEK